MATCAPVAVRPSRLVFAGMLGIAAAALWCLVVVPVPHSIRLSAAIVSVAVYTQAIRRHALLCSSHSVVAIQPLAEGTCIVKSASGAETAATVLSDSVAWSWMLLLRVAQEGKRWPNSILVLRDSVAEDDWRRLSIWLRWQAGDLSA